MKYPKLIIGILSLCLFLISSSLVSAQPAAHGRNAAKTEIKQEKKEYKARHKQMRRAAKADRNLPAQSRARHMRNEARREAHVKHDRRGDAKLRQMQRRQERMKREKLERRRINRNGQ